MNDPIHWNDDPEDDTTASWHGLIGRAERMGRYPLRRSGSRREVEDWWCAVFDEHGELWSSNATAGMIGSGARARELVELVMRFEGAKRLTTPRT